MGLPPACYRARLNNQQGFRPQRVRLRLQFHSVLCVPLAHWQTTREIRRRLTCSSQIRLIRSQATCCTTLCHLWLHRDSRASGSRGGCTFRPAVPALAGACMKQESTFAAFPVAALVAATFTCRRRLRNSFFRYAESFATIAADFEGGAVSISVRSKAISRYAGWIHVDKI
jgi:hypothetical protein